MQSEIQLNEVFSLQPVEFHAVELHMSDETRPSCDQSGTIPVPDGPAENETEQTTSNVMELNVPYWALQLNDCQKIGNSYCGWVSSMDQLELLLTYHRQDTKSSWGIRQTTNSGRSSLRLMWKSQYAPFDGIPFINTGSRAITMECKHGPRRKGNSIKRSANSANSGFKLACPARIYIKQVKKFPDYSLHLYGDKKNMKEAMDRAFFSLKMDGIEGKGEDRWYVQLPTSTAHEFHDDSNPRKGRQRKVPEKSNEIMQCSDLSPKLDHPPKKKANHMHPALVRKIRELVAGGQTDIFPIRKTLRTFVEKELFSQEELPNRHNPFYFPTVYDIQNYVHESLNDLATGSLYTSESVTDSDLSMVEDSVPSTPQLQDVPEPTIDNECVGLSELKTITLTLSQNINQDLDPVLSRIETHMSDGTTEITSELTTETVLLVKKIQPLFFPWDEQENTSIGVCQKSKPEMVSLEHSLQPDDIVPDESKNSVELIFSNSIPLQPTKELNENIYLEN